MSKFWIIAKDVYKKNVKSTSFVIMILAPFLLISIVYLAGSLASEMPDDSKIGLVSDNQQMAQQLEQTKSDYFVFKTVSSEKEAQKQLKDEKIGSGDSCIDCHGGCHGLRVCSGCRQGCACVDGG